VRSFEYHSWVGRSGPSDFNQEADRSFTFAIGGARIVPQLRKVGSQ
jgi:hypothetical protein